MSSGKIAQVVGPVVDVKFATGDKLPEINNALVVYKDNDKKEKTSILAILARMRGASRSCSWQ